MSVKSYFAPEVVKTFSSKHNPDIQLVNFSGNLRLDMGNLTQSGQVIEKIWAKAFSKLLKKNFNPKKVLILGFGAGSAAKIIAKKWSDAKITGVEIDSVIIEIARKYFEVEKIPNLKIINQDATKFIKSLPSIRHSTLDAESIYDLILLDCYQGCKIPANFENPKFLIRLCKTGSQVLINRLFWANHQLKTINFLSKLRQSFRVNTCRTPSNLVISIQV